MSLADDDTFGESPSLKKPPKFNPMVLMVVFSLGLGLISAFAIWGYLNEAQKKVQKIALTRNIVIAAKEIIFALLSNSLILIFCDLSFI